MMLPQRTIDLIKRHEGLRLIAYADTRGFMTIGYGHKILPGEDFSDGLTKQEADALFLSDIDQKVTSARNVVSSYDELNEVRQAVVLDMLYNLGSYGLSKFKRMIAALNAHDYLTAVNEMRNSSWYIQVRSRGVEDCNLMMRGTWL